MHITRVFVATIVLLGGALCACTANVTTAPPVETFANTRQVMLGITIPASDVLFQVGNQGSG